MLLALAQSRLSQSVGLPARPGWTARDELDALACATATAFLQSRADPHCDREEKKRLASSLLKKLSACRDAERFLMAVEKALKAKTNILAWEQAKQLARPDAKFVNACRVELAGALRHHGKFYEAAEELRGVIHEEPDNAEAWIARGLVYLAMGCPLLADVHFMQRCVDVSRGDPMSLRARMRARMQFTESFEARVAKIKLLSNEQTLKCAELLLREGFADSALVLFARLPSSLFSAWLGVAKCHLAKGAMLLEACWALANAIKCAKNALEQKLAWSVRADVLMLLHNYSYAAEDALLADRPDVAAVAKKRGEFLNTREGVTAWLGVLKGSRQWDPFLTPWPEPATRFRVAIAPRGATATAVFEQYIANVALVGRFFGHAPPVDAIVESLHVYDARSTWFMPLSAVQSWMLDPEGALPGVISLVVGEGWLACFPATETSKSELMAASASTTLARDCDAPLLCWGDVADAAQGRDDGLLLKLICGQASARKWTERSPPTLTAWVSSSGHRCVAKARDVLSLDDIIGGNALRPPALFGVFVGRKMHDSEALEVLEMDKRGVWVPAVGVPAEEREALERLYVGADWQQTWTVRRRTAVRWWWLLSVLVALLAVYLATVFGGRAMMAGSTIVKPRRS